MNIPYRTRRILQRIGVIFSILLLLFIIAWFCTVVWLERYIVYTRDGAVLDLNVSSNDLYGEVATPPISDSEISIYYNEGEDAIELGNELKQLEGYFIDIDDMKGDMGGVWDMLEPLSAGTPIMIDLKGGYGSFYYTTSLPGSITSATVSVASVDELIKEMQEKGFYLIARVSAFRDYEFGVKNVPSGLMHVNRLGLWPDEGGCYWLDPTDTAVLNRIASIVDELKALGFNEVVLTDFRFPDSDSYIYNGDKDAALASAANSLAQTCGGSEFTLSFSVDNAAFPLPEGRCRLYMENVDAKSVGAKASQATMENPQVRLVFVAETNDTRFSQYSVLRPITASQVLEAQKANTKNN